MKASETNWSRRTLLRRGVAAVAAGAMARHAGGFLARAAEPRPDPAMTPGVPRGKGPLAGDAADARTADLLRELITRRAVDSTEPWLEAHVILALGANAQHFGRPMIDDMVSSSVVLTTISGRTYPHFDLQLERHPFHFLQIMQLTDVPGDRAFTTPRGRFTRRELVAGSEAVFDPTTHSDEYSWTISVLTHEFPPDRDRFTTARGARVVVADLVEDHLKDTELAYAATFASMDENKPYGRGLIHTKACNGAHLIYGLVDAVRYGYTGHDLRKRFARLVEATLFRIGLEQRLVEATLKGPDPMVRLNADAVKLNFLGHVVEDMGYAIHVGALSPTESQLKVLATARRQLGAVVERIVSEHDLDVLRVNVPNAYSLVLGDSCHAMRGMSYWT